MALQCTDWYLDAYYDDGSISSWYLTTTCYDDSPCQSTVFTPRGNIKVFCGGGGGGEETEVSRTAFKYIVAPDPGIPGDDSIQVRGYVMLEAAGGLFTSVTWWGSQAIWIDASFSYSETGNSATFINSPAPLASTSFTGTVFTSSTQSYNTGVSRTFTYAQAFTP